MKTYGNARFIDCPGVVSDGIGGHAMRDNCWSCAPFWERIPLCPLSDGNGGHQDKSRKLTENGYCKVCRKHFTLVDAQVTDGDEQAVATQFDKGEAMEIVRATVDHRFTRNQV